MDFAISGLVNYCGEKARKNFCHGQLLDWLPCVGDMGMRRKDAANRDKGIIVGGLKRIVTVSGRIFIFNLLTFMLLRIFYLCDLNLFSVCNE
ncbi:hypothetical protein CEXT_63131 [Caerostris extrusa]|uniref:Uncharacterized protein n=1 Tax=Caerostris extrusa TaxID=172846 RepID=A0AAV4TLU5_CAEEX|nr:hypothetical protein CEXT_63131 [Caerostris extrusa]